MHHALKTYAFLISALDGGEWSVSFATTAHWVADWVVAGADMDAWPLKMGPIVCLETSVRITTSCREITPKNAVLNTKFMKELFLFADIERNYEFSIDY
jgi:hypothetical protein